MIFTTNIIIIKIILDNWFSFIQQIIGSYSYASLRFDLSCTSLSKALLTNNISTFKAYE